MRPESWNAKMLNGAPLITDKQFDKLLANAVKNDPVPVVKIFLPYIRWWLGWIYPDNHDRALAVVKAGNKPPELGDVLLSDIVRHRLGTLRPERDMYIKLDKPLSHYLQIDED